MRVAIKPALTAEEWTADSIQRETPNGDVLVVVRDKSSSTQEAGGHHHALAALALNGKPFGFTHEDRHLLFRAFHFVLSQGWTAEDADGLSSLESRIKALLPPRVRE